MTYEPEMTFAKGAHAAAVQAAKEKLPELRVNTLIQQGMALLQGKVTVDDLLKEYGPSVAAAATAYVSCFARDFIEQEIQKHMELCDNEVMAQLAEDGFSEELAEVAVKVGSVITAFCSGRLDETMLMTSLGNCGVQEAASHFIGAAGIDPEVILTASASTVAFAAAAAAYSILSKALEDASLQHEEMLAVKAECEKSTAMILEYRMDLQEKISQYFTEKYDIIEESFGAMDRAILEGDSDGYIRANSALQELFGYDTQFTSQEEFDNLMFSDLDFRL